jgi:Domain of unknown function (DUF4832)
MIGRAGFYLLGAVACIGAFACTSSAGSSVASGNGSAGVGAAAGLDSSAGSPAFGMGGAGANAGGTNAGSANTEGGAGGVSGAASGSAGAFAEVVVRPLATDEAFANPLTGFRPDLGNSNHYATLYRQYIKWNEIENSESDGVDKIKAFSDAAWQGLPALNGKVIPRVYLDWPGQGTYWPQDLTTGDYTSDAFKARLTRLIGRLGQVWDGDPRVAFIQTGLIGQWGEQHDPAPDASLAQLMSDAYTAAFPHKLLENRYPGAFPAPWGIYWDSFGCDQNATILALGTRYLSVPFEGEVAYDYCKPAGADPTSDVSVPANTQKFVDLIRTFHTAALGWIADAPYNASTSAGIDELQKTFGYRFVISEARFPARVHAGDSFSVTLTIVNTGSAPLYYAFPLELSLLDAETHVPVCQTVPSGVDARTWLPGDQWDAEQGKYATPAKSTVVPITVSAPSSLAPGAYVLAVALLDPAGMLPAVRFAIVNYYPGGRQPLGYLGVDEDAPSQLDPNTFTKLADDTSLHYVMAQ